MTSCPHDRITIGLWICIVQKRAGRETRTLSQLPPSVDMLTIPRLALSIVLDHSIYPQPPLNSVFENMMDPTAALQNLTPEQKHAVMTQAQQQANQQIMSSMIESMTLSCFDKCAGVSGDRLDGKEQGW